MQCSKVSSWLVIDCWPFNVKCHTPASACHLSPFLAKMLSTEHTEHKTSVRVCGLCARPEIKCESVWFRHQSHLCVSVCASRSYAGKYMRSLGDAILKGNKQGATPSINLQASFCCLYLSHIPWTCPVFCCAHSCNVQAGLQLHAVAAHIVVAACCCAACCCAGCCCAACCCAACCCAACCCAACFYAPAK